MRLGCASAPATLRSMNNLAGVSNSQGKYDKAEEMHRQVQLAAQGKTPLKVDDNTKKSLTLILKKLSDAIFHGHIVQKRKRIKAVRY